ncbi:MAG: acetyl-CoA carboxylase biotin carboxyl carrier protein [Elusimicrobia bacterium]|nr:acetyl-CoA carboxylase biotin carboxyl carrier protein [Elusimicrobiota bacterium]
MRAHDLSELEIREGSLYLKLSRARAPVFPVAPVGAVLPVVPSVASAAPTKTYHPIASPLAGMFYRSPAPNAASFVKEGDTVALGTVLCIIEAMKVMNEIRSDRPGIVRRIVAENGKPVSSGQELFQLDPLPE